LKDLSHLKNNNCYKIKIGQFILINKERSKLELEQVMPQVRDFLDG